MKNICLLLFVTVANFAVAQSNNYILTMDGIGSIKLGMTQTELEKVLNKKIPLTNPWDTVSGSWQDSAKIKYKTINVELEFQRNYFAADTFNMIIIRMKANSPLCKTASGIGIGTDKLRIIAGYENNVVTLQPGFSNEYYTENSKTRSTVSIKNDSGDHILRFFLLNKRVVGFEVKQFFSDSE